MCIGRLKSVCSFQIFIALLVLLYAYVLSDVAFTMAPLFSKQWFAEMIWWSKFVFLIGVDIPPLPLETLEHKHSHLEVVEFFPATDAQAFDKFTDMLGRRENDQKILILRNVWANYTESPFSQMNSIEYMKKHLNLDNSYNAFVYGKNPPAGSLKTLREVFDKIQNVDGDEIHTISFETTMAAKEKFLWDAYQDLWRTVSPRLEKLIIKSMANTHNFLYYGNRARTPLHAATVADFFFQISNTKRWTFVDKRYMPYMNVQKKFGDTILPPYYLAEDYPTDSIPYTNVHTHPGDLMYFGVWHPHQVDNVHPDQFGMAIGIRPKPFFGPGAINFSPLGFYSLISIPNIILHTKLFKGAEKWILERKYGKDRTIACASPHGGDWDFGFNGEKMTRFDYRIIDGECKFLERKGGYQTKELFGLLDIHADYFR